MKSNGEASSYNRTWCGPWAAPFIGPRCIACIAIQGLAKCISWRAARPSIGLASSFIVPLLILGQLHAQSPRESYPQQSRCDHSYPQYNTTSDADNHYFHADTTAEYDSPQAAIDAALTQISEQYASLLYGLNAKTYRLYRTDEIVGETRSRVHRQIVEERKIQGEIRFGLLDSMSWCVEAIQTSQSTNSYKATINASVTSATINNRKRRDVEKYELLQLRTVQFLQLAKRSLESGSIFQSASFVNDALGLQPGADELANLPWIGVPRDVDPWMEAKVLRRFLTHSISLQIVENANALLQPDGHQPIDLRMQVVARGDNAIYRIADFPLSILVRRSNLLDTAEPAIFDFRVRTGRTGEVSIKIADRRVEGDTYAFHVDVDEEELRRLQLKLQFPAWLSDGLSALSSQKGLVQVRRADNAAAIALFAGQLLSLLQKSRNLILIEYPNVNIVQQEVFPEARCISKLLAEALPEQITLVEAAPATPGSSPRDESARIRVSFQRHTTGQVVAELFAHWPRAPGPIARAVLRFNATGNRPECGTPTSVSAELGKCTFLRCVRELQLLNVLETDCGVWRMADIQDYRLAARARRLAAGEKYWLNESEGLHGARAVSFSDGAHYTHLENKSTELSVLYVCSRRRP